MRLSIIIPVFNGENSINILLTSLVNQTEKLDYLQVIIVDDGSVDNTSKVVNDYRIYLEKICNDFIYLYQVNEGASSARNHGLSFSKGEYVWFIDADDYIEASSFELFNKYVQRNGDIILFDHWNNMNEYKILQERKYLTSKEYLEEANGRLYLWDKLYPYGLLLNERINTSLISMEDFEFNLRILSKNPGITKLNFSLYHYEYNELSISRNITDEKLILLYENTVLAHSLAKNITTNVKGLEIALNKTINYSVLGFFYSLSYQKYKLADFIRAVRLYKKLGFLPVGRLSNKGVKVNLFKILLNFVSRFL